MSAANSPLRYPGGKQVLSRILAHLVKINAATGGTYAEPYAGGAGAALTLLFGEHVDRILINDADERVFAFWSAVLTRTDEFLEMLSKTPVSVAEWKRQREIYLHPARFGVVRVGFATFFLNRCNRSGIIGNGGPIGGKKQTGKWKIGARFNRAQLAERIERIALYKERISVSNKDGVEFLSELSAAKSKKTFVYLDPPYYAKGQDLYLNHYLPGDHEKLSSFLERGTSFDWVLSYDNVPEIRRLYKRSRKVSFDLDYTARERRTGREVMILKEGLKFPSAWRRTIPSRFITAAADAPAIPQ